jgi:hypothetical protein
MSVTGSCHCGATKFELTSIPTEAHRCNCTYCQRAGALWVEVQKDELKFLSQNDEATYAPSGLNVHHFCGKCGNQTWGHNPNWSTIYNNDGTLKQGATEGVPTERQYMVNLNLVDGFDFAALKIEDLDGRNNW